MRSARGDCPDIAYNTFAEKFCNVINKQAPLKNKTIRGNQVPFMTKELAKAIMTRSSLINIFIENKNKQNCQAFAKQRNTCTKLRKKAIKFHFAKVTGNGMMTNRYFWKTVKPFLNSKGDHGQQLSKRKMIKYMKSLRNNYGETTSILSGNS